MRFKPRKNHEYYISELNKRKIAVEPLEEYQGSTVKILHRCTCGNEWFATSNNIFAGNTCGCTKDEINLLRHRNKKTILYYLKINNLYKVGITLYRI